MNADGVPIPPSGLGELATVSLDELNAMAALQTRVDRKYIVPPSVFGPMLSTLAPRYRVLEIDGCQQFGYQSVYFDTVDLDLYQAAATGRRRRYKVRTRTYVDSQLCMLEVKTKGGRGHTSKHRMRYQTGDPSHLNRQAQQFVSDIVGGTSDGLAQALTTGYDRSTLVDPISATRLTIDRNLTCTDWAGSGVTLDAAIIETKSSSAPSPADHWLWEQGIRPAKISKFCTGLAAIHSELRSNKWHRALAERWAPTPAAAL